LLTKDPGCAPLQRELTVMGHSSAAERHWSFKGLQNP